MLRTPLYTPSMSDEEFLVFLFNNRDEIRVFIDHLSTRHPYKNDASIHFTRYVLGLTMDKARQDVVLHVVKFMFLTMWLPEFTEFSASTKKKDTAVAPVAPSSSADLP